MITRNLDEILFNTEIIPVFATKKQPKDSLYAGKCVVNLDENKALHLVSDRYKLRTNESLIRKIRDTHAGFTPRFCYYRNNKAYFHIIGTLPNVVSTTQICIEIINSYDGNTSPKMFYGFKNIESDNVYSIVYTNLPLHTDTNNCMLSFPVLDVMVTYIIEKIEQSKIPIRIEKQVKDKLFPNDRLVKEFTGMQLLYEISEIFFDSGWYSSSFETARNTMAFLYDKFNKFIKYIT